MRITKQERSQRQVAAPITSKTIPSIARKRNQLLVYGTLVCLLQLTPQIAFASRLSGEGESERTVSKGGHESRDDGDWSSFRNGSSSTVADTRRLATRWSQKEGISWQVELPGYGQSSPIILDNRIFVTAVKGPQKEENLLVCIDQDSGEELWTTRQKSTSGGPSNYMYSRAAPTPVADQTDVFAFFESGDLIAVNHANGEIRWHRDLKEETDGLQSRHGIGSSLAQTDDLVFLNIEHDGPSKLLGISKSDGSTVWSAERPSGSSWSSPVVMGIATGDQVILSAAGLVAGYLAENGELIWKIEGVNGNSVPSPLVHEGRIYLGARVPEFGSAGRAAESNMCLDLSGNSANPRIAWRSERCVSDYASPVICGDYVFLIDGSGILGCLDRETGREVYRKRLGFECWATPIAHNNHLYIFGKNGTTAVVRAGDGFELVSENSLWDPNSPPEPVSYKEYYADTSSSRRHGGREQDKGDRARRQDGDGSSGEGHGQRPEGDSEGSQGENASPNPGASMLAGLLRSDTNGDRVLSGDEIPGRLLGVMENIDLNQDGRLDISELEKMAESFAARRSGSRNSSRDPIVYGVAANGRGIVIRTGTRLYCIREALNEEAP